MEDRELGNHYKDGDVIVRQGDTGDSMFVVQQGRLEVVAERGDAGEVHVRNMEAGDFFGEMAIFEREVRSATVRALGDARVLTIDKKTFLRRLHEDPSLAFNLVRIMSRRIRTLTDQLGDGRAEGDPASKQRDRERDER